MRLTLNGAATAAAAKGRAPLLARARGDAARAAAAVAGGACSPSTSSPGARPAGDGERFVMRRPDDFHVHFREGLAMEDAVRMSAQGGFGKALAMPNTRSPVVNAEMALAYGGAIMRSVPESARGHFSALMTLYLTDDTRPEDIHEARRASEAARGSLGPAGGIVACKLYPANATTNSSKGVTDVRRLKPVLEAMRDCGMLLLVHGEKPGPLIDIFDRERMFIQDTMEFLVSCVPGLKIVMEHITTAEAADFVARNAGAGTLAATITPQHLLLNRNALFTPGLRPHHYCLPVLKRETHRQALLEAVASGSPYFFLGTDSAPHSRQFGKECACGCAGIFSAPVAMSLYAKAFEDAGIPLSELEKFSSERGADFYGLPRNGDRVALVRRPMTVPSSYPFGYVDDDRRNRVDDVVPLMAGEELVWTLEDAARPGVGESSMLAEAA